MSSGLQAAKVQANAVSQRRAMGDALLSHQRGHALEALGTRRRPENAMVRFHASPRRYRNELVAAPSWDIGNPRHRLLALGV